MDEALRTAELDVATRILVVGKNVRRRLDLVALTDEEKAAKKLSWKTRMCHVKHVVAPMVDQSELGFRMMMRAHGAQLCFSPMVHAMLFARDASYRRRSLSSCARDRPLVVQFCANEPATLLDACLLVEDFCDGVDLNLGCPQLIARRGRYGAYLQENVDLICKMVSSVHTYCRLPLSCKIRILDDIDSTIAYARALERAGACMLTVHGRTREQRGANTGLANWDAIRRVASSVDIPVVANGNIQCFDDVERCFVETGVCAVMSAEGVLSNPLVFEGRLEANWAVAREYLQYAAGYNSAVSAIRAHLFRICHCSLLEYSELREKMSYVCSLREFQEIVDEIERRVKQSPSNAISYPEAADGKLPHWLCQPYVRPTEKPESSANADSDYRARRRAELDALAEKTGLSKRQIRKREKRRIEDRKERSKKQTYPKCLRCGTPASQGCKYMFCRNCCRYNAALHRLDCKAHNLHFMTKNVRCGDVYKSSIVESDVQLLSEKS